MGWGAYYKDTLQRIAEEDNVGRPMQDGQDGKLLLVTQEDYGHKVGVDLKHGLFLIDYDDITVQNQALEIRGVKSYIFICDETNIGADLQDLVRSEPDDNGWFEQHFQDLIWRPIWFTRHIATPFGEVLVKCIGAQTTLPEQFGGKNLKSFVSIFPDGRVGVTDGAYILDGL